MRLPLLVARPAAGRDDGLRGVLRRRRGRRAGHGRGGVLPAGRSSRAGRRRPRRTSRTSPSPGRSRTTWSCRSRRPRRSRTPTSWWSSTGFQPPVDDAVEPGATGEVVDVAEVVDLTPSPRRTPDDEGPALLAGPAADGRRSTEVVADAAGDDRPRHTPTTYRANADALRADLEQLDADVRAGAERLRARHGRGLARRVRLPGAVRPGVRADRRPLPRRRADPGRPGPAPGPDRRRGDHHGLLRAAGQPAAARRPWPTTWGSTTAVLDPIEGLSDETADEDYLSLMRDEPRRSRGGERCLVMSDVPSSS